MILTLLITCHNTHSTQLFSKYFGETEHRLRQLFATARQHTPCVIFLDEIDALGAQRGKNQ
jgi:SpoVK/Ycf46/Vps4 family AAA+-type ATPase